ncbi:unnamed protein product [Cuscuta epithymum]|uniref:Uncharacterized protein n=1 Tax=Cuscuta epithymum TaxID=186058 RepID=A0AAV0G941_9ASTE|nr:unnamed protein product [Cuscuta epithymum]
MFYLFPHTTRDPLPPARLKNSALGSKHLSIDSSSDHHHSYMDLLRKCVVESTKNNNGEETLSYFVKTVHGRKILVAMFTPTDEGGHECHASQEWKHFLRSTGYFRLLPKKFHTKAEIKHKLNHYLEHPAAMPVIQACPRTGLVHFPDVLQFTVVWFLLQATEFEFARIPECMHRHLFEHAKGYARLVYGGACWPVKVDDFCFSSGFTEFLSENDVAFGTHMLLRHIGDFTFEVLMFDDLGFSIDRAAPPSGSVDIVDRPDYFRVHVDSCLPDSTYRQLYCPPSFLYVHKQTPKKFCEAFLRSCTDMRGRLQVFYGKQSRLSIVREESMLRDIQKTFHLHRQTTLAFIKHGRGRTLLMAISKCGLEEPPKRAKTYEICTPMRADC